LDIDHKIHKIYDFSETSLFTSKKYF